MLFLSESVYEARMRLMGELDRGEIAAEHCYTQLLEVDPADQVALMGLGSIRQAAGDLAGAEEFFWRAVQAHPCSWHPYLALAQLLAQSDQTALSQALAELAFSKLLLDEEELEDTGPEQLVFDLEGTESLNDLSKPEQIEALVEALRQRRDLEPLAVTDRVRPYRLIHQLQEESGLLDRTVVDALLQEGESIVPLLVGVLRGWAQDFLHDGEESTVENTLALLGEIGQAEAIPHLLEFATLDDINLSGPALWAFDRIIESRPEQAVQVIAGIAPGLRAIDRMVVLEKLLRHPGLDRGVLFERLTENLERVPKSDRPHFFPILVTSMLAVRGRTGAELARAMLRRHVGLLSRKVARECEALLEAFGDGTGLSTLPPAKPSQWSVYDICAGAAAWENVEEEEEEEEEENFLRPQPLRRQHIPGRNDPCWCGSGKKYKKCHLEADERPAGHAPALKGELDGVRGRIRNFFEETAPPEESGPAMEEFFGSACALDDDDALVLIDWMVHDWVVPRLGCTVMKAFLERHGSQLTPEDRELVESWSRSFIDLYEVQEVKKGKGVEVKRLRSGQVFFVHDIRMSESLVRWDGILARMVDGERGHEFTGIGVGVPRPYLQRLQGWMEEDKDFTGLSWPEYLKQNWPRIRLQNSKAPEEWLQSLRLSNSDGEPILFSKSVYRVLDAAALIAALRGCPDVVEDKEGGRYTWLKGHAGDDGRTVLGSFHINGSELVFECNSAKRSKRGKKLLAGLAGSALRHLRDEATDMEEMKRRAMEEPPPERTSQDEIPPEVRNKLITEALERHYAKWPDMPLPALKGQTPRQAARTTEGRKRVTTLLRDFENMAARNRRLGEPCYDISRLRAELGVEE